MLTRYPQTVATIRACKGGLALAESVSPALNAAKNIYKVMGRLKNILKIYHMRKAENENQADLLGLFNNMEKLFEKLFITGASSHIAIIICRKHITN